MSEIEEWLCSKIKLLPNHLDLFWFCLHGTPWKCLSLYHRAHHGFLSGICRRTFTRHILCVCFCVCVCNPSNWCLCVSVLLTERFGEEIMRMCTRLTNIKSTGRFLWLNCHAPELPLPLDWNKWENILYILINIPVLWTTPCNYISFKIKSLAQRILQC